MLRPSRSKKLPQYHQHFLFAIYAPSPKLGAKPKVPSGYELTRSLSRPRLIITEDVNSTGPLPTGHILITGNAAIISALQSRYEEQLKLRLQYNAYFSNKFKCMFKLLNESSSVQEILNLKSDGVDMFIYNHPVGRVYPT